MAWWRKTRTPKQPVENRRTRMPENLWIKCKGCGEIIWRKEVSKGLSVCPKCDYHFNISARQRLKNVFDHDDYLELFTGLRSGDPLEFTDTKPYADRLEAYIAKSGEEDAVVVGRGAIGGIEAIVGAMEYGFMGGSMGSVVGEKVTLAVEKSSELRLPLVVFSASGGARMQEGVLSLMQMAKISAALSRHAQLGLPFISVLTDPTTGGVTASFAMLGDVNIAEPKALIGFAGPRVIQQTTRQELPEGFQRAEFLLEHGMLDMIVPRTQMKETLARLFRLLG